MRLIVAITSRPAGFATLALFLLFCSIAFGQLLPGWRRASVGSVLLNSEQFRQKLISADDKDLAILENGVIRIDK
jgi:hypothetical protein